MAKRLATMSCLQELADDHTMTVNMDSPELVCYHAQTRDVGLSFEKKHIFMKDPSEADASLETVDAVKIV